MDVWINRFPSVAPTVELSTTFVTHLVDVERTIFEYVYAAAQQDLPDGLPALSFYADRARAAAEQRRVDVVQGWPPYPGQIPAIGVAAGPETEDAQHEIEQGGFAGTDYKVVDDERVASANYYAEALYATVIVELIHENRDERDRLHNELRRILFPLRRELPRATRLVRRVRVDAEKQEQEAGPPAVESPRLVYISVFTVHVYHELLEAQDVGGPESIVGRIDATVTAD